MGLSETFKIICWLSQLLEDLGESQNETIIFQNNSSSI